MYSTHEDEKRRGLVNNVLVQQSLLAIELTKSVTEAQLLSDASPSAIALLSGHMSVVAVNMPQLEATRRIIGQLQESLELLDANLRRTQANYHKRLNDEEDRRNAKPPC